MSLELTGVHGLLKRHKLFTHKQFSKYLHIYRRYSLLYPAVLQTVQLKYFHILPIEIYYIP